MVAVRSSPAGRTKVWFGVERYWLSHWPLSKGRGVPKRLERIFEPFQPVWVEVEPQIRMFLDPEDLVSREIMSTGEWEADSWAAMVKHLPPGATFIDIGAHIGYYS